MNRLACYARKLELYPKSNGNQVREGQAGEWHNQGCI